MFKHALFATLLLSLVSTALGCDQQLNSPLTDSADAAVAQSPTVITKAASKAKVGTAAAVKASYAYSPFVLRIASHSIFRTVSFKDVGSHLGHKDADTVYEALADALALEMNTIPELSMVSNVDYDASNLDPSNHLSCGADRIYVDFWRAKEPAKWGYSLWSGCGEDDNFAWKEIPYSPVKGDLVTNLKPLAKGIVSSLKAANTKSCYQKMC